MESDFDVAFDTLWRKHSGEVLMLLASLKLTERANVQNANALNALNDLMTDYQTRLRHQLKKCELTSRK